MESERRTKQYSVDDLIYTGALNLKLVLTDAVSDISILSGVTVISENGRIVFVGYPFSIVLICIETGILVSLVLKNRSTLERNTPPSSSTMNDWARGSYQPICLDSVLVVVTTLSSLTVSLTISAFLTAKTFSWTVCKVPDAEYVVSADESTAPNALLFSSEVVNLKVLVPVAQRGLASFLGEGIKKHPWILPTLSVNKRRSLTTALAPDVWPTRTSPTCILPK